MVTEGPGFWGPGGLVSGVMEFGFGFRPFIDLPHAPILNAIFLPQLFRCSIAYQGSRIPNKNQVTILLIAVLAGVLRPNALQAFPGELVYRCIHGIQRWGDIVE